MKIVIDIPNWFYNAMMEHSKPIYSQSLGDAVRDGTPLPEGHGDLIDKEKFKKWIETQDGDRLMTEYYLDALDMQEPIVGGSHDGDID